MFEDLMATLDDLASWFATPDGYAPPADGMSYEPAYEPAYDPAAYEPSGGSYVPLYDPYGYVGPASGSIYDPGLGPIYDPYDYNANIYQTLPDSPLSGFWG